MSDPTYSITDEQLAKATELFQEALYESTKAKQEYEARAQRLTMLTAKLEKINFAYHIERDQEYQAVHVHPSGRDMSNVVSIEAKRNEKEERDDGYL